MSNRRIATAVVTLILLLGIAFSFPGVRAAASQFLGMFRVQKFAAISISPEQIAMLKQVEQQGLTPGRLEILDEPGTMTPVESLSEAASATGAPVRSLRELGEPKEIYVVDGGHGRLVIDLENARAILDATGVDPLLLPDNLEGAPIEVVTFPSVEQHWSDGTMLMQTQSPIVEYPTDLDPVVLGGALLQVLGMNEEEAGRLAQEIDWTSTLLLPVPQDFAAFNEVSIDGVSGIALSGITGEGSAVLWQKDDYVYLLIGKGKFTDELVDLTGSLR